MTDTTRRPPIVFRDARGREWFPIFDDSAIEELRDHGFDLDAAANGDDHGCIVDLWGNNERLSVLMLLVCWRQTNWTIEEAAGELGRDFRAAIPIDNEATTTRAIEALVWSLRRRYPGSAVIGVLARILPALRRQLREEKQSIGEG